MDTRTSCYKHTHTDKHNTCMQTLKISNTYPNKDRHKHNTRKKHTTHTENKNAPTQYSQIRSTQHPHTLTHTTHVKKHIRRNRHTTHAYNTTMQQNTQKPRKRKTHTKVNDIGPSFFYKTKISAQILKTRIFQAINHNLVKTFFQVLCCVCGPI